MRCPEHVSIRWRPFLCGKSPSGDIYRSLYILNAQQRAARRMDFGDTVYADIKLRIQPKMNYYTQSPSVEIKLPPFRRLFCKLLFNNKLTRINSENGNFYLDFQYTIKLGWEHETTRTITFTEANGGNLRSRVFE